MIKTHLKLLWATFMFIPLLVCGQVELPPVFSSNMVLPRNVDIPITGKAKPKTNITVTIGEQSHKVKSNSKGRWEILLDPMPHGGPFILEIKEEQGDKLVLDNLLVGDLWLCAGQSNMQYTPNMLNYKETPDDDYIAPNLRLCSVWVGQDYLPREKVSNAVWQEVNKETARNFSAVGYFFGKDLVKDKNIPIGLISSNLGATTIETWMGMDVLKTFPQFDEVTEKISKINKSYETIEKEFNKTRKKWDSKYYLKGPGLDEKWYEQGYDYSDWEQCTLPAFFSEFGYASHDGSMWFKRTFDLDTDQLKNDFNIVLNQIDDYDRVWVNGVQIGESFGKSNFRNYTAPKEILLEEGNLLTVRVFDIGGKGGIYTNAFWGNPVLNGTWKYKKGISIDSSNFPKPEVGNGSPFSHPMLLYNASIAPLHKLPITGVIWYQGEANEARAVEYADLLPAMIKDWREKWNQPEMPFLVVQLANYKQEDKIPANSNWAELRESQMKASILKNVDIVTTIDIGDANDIHPYNKKEVAKRLALLAKHYNYGEELKKGPVYKSHSLTKSSILIQFDTYGSKLTSKDKFGYLRGFAIAGENGEFKWAKAELVDTNTVKVYHENGNDPKYVRYAWSDNPGPLDLINTEGLPAFPFRTDNFELSTSKNTYQYDPHAF
ncbi:sialate O-acetylesterase [Allomuricauda sp. F6463D]|uniref:sialate O-acetylesterase n=1 Tax=Allomuricauda sp. F6463D TaxID=2926409 RepID=UPI001FF1D189|nr:sialate O-acetylesterase [Muricauda sp. F6463D]MCK0162090.1 beta galactosidase jelly roll domain-containing protein [Muricauda sp. F6463D]